MSLQTKLTEDGREVIMNLPERFDFSVHSDFRKAYEGNENAKKFIVNLRNTTYMDSSALGMMLQLKEHAEKDNGKVIIKNASGNILQILSIANFDKIFSVI